MAGADEQGWIRGPSELIGRRRPALTAAMVLAAVAQAVFAFTPLIQRDIVDDAILSDRARLAPLLALLVAAGLVTYLLGVARRSLGGRAAVDVQHDIQVAVHRHMQHLDAARRDQLRTGDIMSRASSDAALVQIFLQTLGVAVGNLAQLVVSFVLMAYLSPVLALVLGIGIPIFWYVSLRFSSQTFPANWMDQRYVGEVAGVVEEAVTGVRIVKAFGQESQEQNLLRASATRLFQSRVRTARISSRYTATLQAIPTFGTLGVLSLGGWLALHEHISLGVFLAFSSYVVQLVAPVRILSGTVPIAQQARAGSQRIRALLAIKPLVTDLPHAKELTNPDGRIEFRDVSFGYTPDRELLHNITLRVEAGERIAIVGGSGSGKSTLALLMARFYEASSGTITVDDDDVRSYTLESLRRTVGIVFEDSFLFATTIRENIAFGRPDASESEIEQAARIAQAHNFICALPDGYSTVVGERGFTLSGGQRQRIALARTALANPKILVLDDATSAIDARTEERIHNSLNELMAGRTTVLIAHRHSTLRLADRVVLLDGGQIVAEGTTDNLLATSALFRELLTGPDVAPAALSDTPVASLDPAAWPDDVSRDGAPRLSSRSSETLAGAVSGGAGPGFGGARLAGLAGASPTLIAAVERLPVLCDDPGVDLDRETAPDDSFSFTKLLRPYRWPLAFSAALVFVDATTGLAAPWLVRHGVDSGVVAKSQGALWRICLIFLAVQLLSWANAIAMAFQTARTAERMLFGLRARTFAHLQRLSLSYYEQHQAGKIMTRMTSDVEAFAQLLQQGLLAALVSILSSGGVLVTLLILSPTLSLSLALLVPVLVASTLLFRRASNTNYLTARARVSLLYAELQESLAGVRVSQSMSQQAANEARFAALAAAYQQSRRRAVDLIAIFFPFIQLLNVLNKTVALVIGARLLEQGRITPGLLIAFLLYLDQFYLPVLQLSTVFDQWLQARVAITQLTELLQTPTSTPERPDAIDPGRISGRIGFVGVRFAYPSTGLTAMADVNVEIPPGQVVALVGTTGAGKSTLVKLVARFYDPTDGHVLIDGMPLRDLHLSTYRHQLGFVPQEPFLFSGTVATNIAYGRPGANDLDIERAARRVGAHEFIVSLPDGYHTPVAEQGRSLSAGQRQLLSLARAELVDPAILLLDEATANLDLATEARVQQAMGLVARGRTTLLIAHRLQTARNAQRILVVDDGHIVEDGSHGELVARGGTYAELWSAFIDNSSHAGAETAIDGSSNLALAD